MISRLCFVQGHKAGKLMHTRISGDFPQEALIPAEKVYPQSCSSVEALDPVKAPVLPLHSPSSR